MLNKELLVPLLQFIRLIIYILGNVGPEMTLEQRTFAKEASKRKKQCFKRHHDIFQNLAS